MGIPGCKASMRECGVQEACHWQRDVSVKHDARMLEDERFMRADSSAEVTCKTKAKRWWCMVKPLSRSRVILQTLSASVSH
jgi:hypothetical protein